MPAILTLEGRWQPPDVRLGGYGASPGCVNCAVLSDAASDATNLATAITKYTAQLLAAHTAAKYAGVLGGLIGAIAGFVVGRHVGEGKHHGALGAAGGGIVLGLGTYYASSQLLMPTFVAPPTTQQQILNQDLSF